MPTESASHRPRRGFTLIELLIVIGVIALLVGIVMAVGVSVTGSSKTKLTEGAIQTLESALAEFESSAGVNVVPAIVELRNPSNSREKVLHPVADAMAWDGGDGALLDSVGMFIQQLKNQSPSAHGVVGQINSKLIGVRSVHEEGSISSWEEPHQSMMSVSDAWGNPIRYVHPQFDGQIFGGPSYPNGGSPGAPVPLDAAPGEKNPFGLPLRPRQNTPGDPGYGTDKIRRYSGSATGKVVDASPDADGGICPNNKPYFYSAGPDGKVGFGQNGEDYNADNVYVVQPQFPEK